MQPNLPNNLTPPPPLEYYYAFCSDVLGGGDDQSRTWIQFECVDKEWMDEVWQNHFDNADRTALHAALAGTPLDQLFPRSNLTDRTLFYRLHMKFLRRVIDQELGVAPVSVFEVCLNELYLKVLRDKPELGVDYWFMVALSGKGGSPDKPRLAGWHVEWGATTDDDSRSLKWLFGIRRLTDDPDWEKDPGRLGTDITQGVLKTLHLPQNEPPPQPMPIDGGGEDEMGDSSDDDTDLEEANVFPWALPQHQPPDQVVPMDFEDGDEMGDTSEEEMVLDPNLMIPNGGAGGHGPLPQLLLGENPMILQLGASVPFVGAFAVGGGNCNVLYDTHRRAIVYFDFGKGFYAPRPYVQPCLCYDPLVILSHWHTDHYTLARVAHNKAAALGLRWLVPQQNCSTPTVSKVLGPLQVAVPRRLRVWDAFHDQDDVVQPNFFANVANQRCSDHYVRGVDYEVYSWGVVERCSGGVDANGSDRLNSGGLAVSVRVQGRGPIYGQGVAPAPVGGVGGGVAVGGGAGGGAAVAPDPDPDPLPDNAHLAQVFDPDDRYVFLPGDANYRYIRSRTGYVQHAGGAAVLPEVVGLVAVHHGSRVVDGAQVDFNRAPQAQDLHGRVVYSYGIKTAGDFKHSYGHPHPNSVNEYQNAPRNWRYRLNTPPNADHQVPAGGAHQFTTAHGGPVLGPTCSDAGHGHCALGWEGQAVGGAPIYLQPDAGGANTVRGGCPVGGCVADFDFVV